MAKTDFAGHLSLFVTGLVTASGGAWNASIVAEYFHFKGQTFFTTGLGSNYQPRQRRRKFQTASRSHHTHGSDRCDREPLGLAASLCACRRSFQIGELEPTKKVWGISLEQKFHSPSRYARREPQTTPSTLDGNYHWRFQTGSLTPNLAQRLADLAEVTDRLPEPLAEARAGKILKEQP